MTTSSQKNDIFQDKDGNLWFVTNRTEKPVIDMEQMAMPGQRAQEMKKKTGEIGSDTWNGFHKVGRKEGKREKSTPTQLPIQPPKEKKSSNE